jgi:hypothetical protein
MHGDCAFRAYLARNDRDLTTIKSVFKTASTAVVALSLRRWTGDPHVEIALAT